MTQLAIIGAGIAGSCAYRACADLNINCVVVTDNRPSASQVALATLHGDKAEQAARIYEAWSVPIKRGALVTGYRRASREATFDKAWMAVDPVEALNVPTITETPLGAKTLDCTANRLWGKTSWGATWIHPNPGALTERETLRVHHYAPYKHVTAISWSHGARLGSSVGKTETDAIRAAEQLLQIAFDSGMLNDTEGWTLETGVRVQAETVLTPDRFGGFHRDGYTLAAIHAHQAVQQAL